jgi:hypothetical protein
MYKYFITLNKDTKEVKRYKFDGLRDGVYYGLDNEGLCHEFNRNDIIFHEDLEDLCYDNERELVRFMMRDLKKFQYILSYMEGALKANPAGLGFLKEFLMELKGQCSMIDRLSDEARFFMKLMGTGKEDEDDKA